MHTFDPALGVVLLFFFLDRLQLSDAGFIRTPVEQRFLNIHRTIGENLDHDCAVKAVPFRGLARQGFGEELAVVGIVKGGGRSLQIHRDIRKRQIDRATIGIEGLVINDYFEQGTVDQGQSAVIFCSHQFSTV